MISMLRRHKMKSKKSPPIKALYRLFEIFNLEVNDWRQDYDLPFGLMEDDYNTVYGWVSAVLGKSIDSRNHRVILHSVRGVIDTHTDSISKTVYVIPILLPKTSDICLWEEDRCYVIDRDHYYTINDFNRHGVDALCRNSRVHESHAVYQLLTVEKSS